MMSLTRRTIDWTAVLKSTPFSPEIQKHLALVYADLLAGLVVASCGVMLDLQLRIGGRLTALVSIGVLIWMSSTPSHEQSKRLLQFAGFAFLQGLSIGPLVGMVMFFDVGILWQTLVLSASLFGALSAAALFARRREYFWLSGLISAGMTALLVARFLSFFVGQSDLLFSFQLWGGLAVFVLYTLFDTQLIVEKAANGDRDHILHAVGLLLDLIALFVRIAIILLRNANKKKQRKRR
jgi:FtsH-binding integral membrane protein